MRERLLVGETLSLDLVNTEWVEQGKKVDFLDDPDAASLWFAEYGFDAGSEDVDALRQARAAIRACLEAPGADAYSALNVVLARGHEVTLLVDGAPVTRPETEPGWSAAWQAARQFAELLQTRPDRIRQCAHPECVLYFLDTSRNGSRRWHSMDTCGARTKSARHYRKTREHEESK
ncbi:CGNR zinc finger domain-containing protein [Microbacterium sp. NPDC089695]|uniref:CGNR zinc finger domain-containing protein n=1 Tax=Microbacterium sp. NPDC089695 TaxID=3364198 RepID=UPI0037F9CD5F